MKEEIEKQILKHFKNNNETIVKISTGMGKTKIIEDIMDLERTGDLRILIITDRYIMQEQYADMMKKFFSKNKQCDIISYKILKYDEIEKFKLKGFHIVILDNVNNISKEEYKEICEITSESKKLSFYSIPSNWLDEIVDFKYYFRGLENQIENLCIKILKEYRFDLKNGNALISIDGSMLRPDFYAERDGKNIVVEIKIYRDRYITGQALNRIIARTIKYRTTTNLEKETPILFLLMCEVEDKIKDEIYIKYNSIILDIRNIKYLCMQNIELMSELENTISYPINDIKEQKILNEIFKNDEAANYKEEKKSDTEKLINKLLNVNSGKQDKTYRKYEETCTEIIKYLFESEFTQIKEQLETKDDLFVMDLLCGLKGSSTFWRILIEHYNSRFIVFEYKNYKEEINQNNIFVTEKYLFNSALRNVAIIISRIRF
ncbi:MAG: DEAD/DEAH box helicase family protein [Clostridia bacterium]|nr:DEAD/DEAH box helicase family protein [Clostridia bacterium]